MNQILFNKIWEKLYSYILDKVESKLAMLAGNYFV